VRIALEHASGSHRREGKRFVGFDAEERAPQRPPRCIISTIIMVVRDDGVAATATPRHSPGSAIVRYSESDLWAHFIGAVLA
jgi:hypothetical protein